MTDECAAYSRDYLRGVVVSSAVLQVFVLLLLAAAVVGSLSELSWTEALTVLPIGVCAYLILIGLFNYLRLSARVIVRPSAQELVVANVPWSRRPIRFAELNGCQIARSAGGVMALGCPQFELGGRVLLGLWSPIGSGGSPAPGNDDSRELLPEPFRSAPVSYVFTDSPTYRSALRLTTFVGLAALYSGEIV